MTEQHNFYTFPSWLLGDHLGSTSMTANADGTFHSEVRYSAFGEIRYQNGTLTTDYLYTGQRQEAEIGLYYYVARWYDPAIGRFIQADSVVPDPGKAIGYDRFAYVANNPVRYIDPSGHVLVRLENGDYFSRSTVSIINLNIAAFETDYGVKFDAGWKLSDKVAMRKDIKKLARKMADAIGIDSDGSTIFRKAFKNISIKSHHRGGFGGCEVFGRQIECGSVNIGGMTDFENSGLVIHELGHIFDHRIARRAGGDYYWGYARTQLSTLGNGVVASDGTEVVGTFSNVGFVDISLGYKSSGRKDNRPYQQHIDGGSGEQWADMFMNWALDDFGNNIYGDARGNYMDLVMRKYILSTIGGPARSIYE